jgi:hypothetical protein
MASTNPCLAGDLVNVPLNGCIFDHPWTGAFRFRSPPFQIAFFRNIFGLAFLLPLLMCSRFAVLRTQRIDCMRCAV